MKKLVIIGWFLISGVIFSQITYESFADSLQGNFDSWVNQRIINAKNGIIEKIEMPLVVRTLAWGCKCPDNYIGVGVNVKEGPYIYPVDAKGLPVPDENGYSLIVTGYFTGEIKNLALRDNHEEPEQWNYMVPVFKITKWGKNSRLYNANAPTVNGKTVF